jgi:hypothetical protein
MFTTIKNVHFARRFLDQLRLGAQNANLWFSGTDVNFATFTTLIAETNSFARQEDMRCPTVCHSSRPVSTPRSSWCHQPDLHIPLVREQSRPIPSR